MKLCPTCGVEKESDQFHKAKSTKDGLNWQCKLCHKARMRAQVERIAAADKVIPDEKLCTGCGEKKPSAAYSRNRVMLDGLSNWCKACDKGKQASLVDQYRKRETIQYPDKLTCSKCGLEKTLGQFSKSKGRRNGVSGWCKECTRIQAALIIAKNRIANADRNPYEDPTKTKTCSSGCGETKPVTEFGRAHITPDGLSHLCKCCALKRSREYANNNRERIMWLVAKSRAKKQRVPFEIELSDIVIPERCPVLGFEWGSDRKIDLPSLDKIIPEKGYVKGNIVVVSMRANRLKNDATPEELRRLADFYGSL